MVPLNYNQLYYFFRIAELGSISEASKKVLISSPALSMQLKELEESLGSDLFDRVGKKLVLTETGAIVFEYAKDIFKLGYELKDTINDRERIQDRIKIDIGCQDTIPKEIVDQLLAFLIESKKCKVILQESNRDELLKMQAEFKFDLILTDADVSNPYIYESRQLMKESLVVVGHPRFKKNKFSIQDIEALPFVLPTYDSSLRQKLDHYFRSNKLTPDVVAEVADKATEIDLALKGLGVITAMKGTMSTLLQQKQLVELHSLKGLHEEVWLIIGKRKILNPLSLFAMKNFSLKR